MKLLKVAALVVVTTVSPSLLAMVASQSEQLAAHKAYDSLIKPLSTLSLKATKDKRIKDLEAVGASSAKEALQEIVFQINKVLGKNNTGSIQVSTSASSFIKGLDLLIPEPIPQIISNAVHWTDGMLDRTLGTFAQKRDYTNGRIAYYESKKERIPLLQLRQHLDMELESFDERYKPVIDALKKIKQSPMLPDSLTMLGKLYKDILVEKGAPQPPVTPQAPIISEESKKSVWPASFLIKKAHQGPVAHIFVTKMNTIISVGKTDNHIHIWGWDGNKYKVIRMLIDEASTPISEAAFSPLSNMLAISHADEAFIRIWNVQTGTKKRLSLLGKLLIL